MAVIKLKIQECIWGNKLLSVNLNAKCKIEVLTTLHKSKYVQTVSPNCYCGFHWRIIFPPDYILVGCFQVSHQGQFYFSL